jgi:hypothetical protein
MKIADMATRLGKMTSPIAKKTNTLVPTENLLKNRSIKVLMKCPDTERF